MLEGPNDLMPPKTVGKLARSDSEQGGGLDLDAIGLCKGLQDLLPLRLAQAGEEMNSRCLTRPRATPSYGIRRHLGTLAFAVRR